MRKIGDNIATESVKVIRRTNRWEKVGFWKPKRKPIDFCIHSIGTNGSGFIQKRQHSAGKSVKQQQLKVELEFRRAKIKMEQNQRKSKKDMTRLDGKAVTFFGKIASRMRRRVCY